MESSKTYLLRSIRDEIINLTTSPLYTYRTENNYYPVIGEGNHDATIMFIGEAPGKNEAATARPFCGAAGRVLDQMLATIELDRKSVYITNIVKDRPPDNRDPTTEEIELYSPYLERQIDIIQPSVIATLGRFSMQYLLHKFNAKEKNETISKLHGSVIETEARYGRIHIVPLYHPAVALYNGSTRKTLEKDFRVLSMFA